MKVIVGDQGKHVGVAHCRILLGVDEIELDLQAGQRTFEVELRLGEHEGEHVQAASHLGPILLPALSGEVPALDVRTHDRHLPASRSEQPGKPTRSSSVRGGSPVGISAGRPLASAPASAQRLTPRVIPRGHWTRSGTATRRTSA